MRFSSLFLILGTLSLVSCGGGGSNNKSPNSPQCSDGIDNDGDGLVDFPDDPGCIGPNDDSEDSLPSPQCSDGRDNDNDGKIDFPNDPGCLAPNQDSETDDCPDGPGCPQCGNGKDDDNNGLIDYPNDPGCLSASDNDEFTDNPIACGANVMIKKLPFDGHVTGTLMVGGASNLNSPSCGGTGAEDVYELRISSPKVVTATTDFAGSMGSTGPTDTVLYIRSSDCANPATELGCNDDAVPPPSLSGTSSLSVSIATPGVYYLVVDSHDSSTGGPYEMQVDFLAGEGEPCDAPATCGPGLICRIPLGGQTKVCSKHVCSDGVDDDGDGKLDYPTDPGCTSPDDDDESDPCPGAGCPACADGIDNDGDGKIDYPNDPTCTSASGASEVCVSTDGVAEIAAAVTSDDTTNAHHDVTLSCGSSTSTAPDKTYRLDLPKTTSLTITTTPTGSDFDAVTALFGATCGGTPIGGATVGCQDYSPITETNLAAGTYYVVVAGYSNDFEPSGPFTLTVSGTIAANQSCESPLVAAGALSCTNGYACKGTVGSRTCQPARCSDGIDNDGDGKIDYPFDPGCDSPADDDEANPTTLPVCGNNVDDDGDNTKDYPADFGCSSAAGTSEVFCSTEHDAPVLINAKTMTGTTTGKANDEMPTCTANSTAPDIVYALQLPVPVQALQIDTIGSSFDTVVSLTDTSCGTTILCVDDGTGTVGPSQLNLTNLTAGGYAVVVDGYALHDGTVTLNVNGTVGSGVACTAAAFTGANAWLKCASGLTCTGGKCM